MWQWFHFLQGQVPPGRSVLRLNLDETSVRFWYEPRLGLRRPTSQVPRAGFARQASRGQLRRAFSHVGIICDDTSLQPHLPQVLLVNERTVTAEQHRHWTSLPGCNAKLWRGKSAWINDEVFAKIIRELGKVLRARAGNRQAILLLDAHNCHFSKGTLAACRDYDIWPVIIPARMTSMLQPLDTHVFSRFKMFLRTRMHQLMLTDANKDFTSEQVIDGLLHAIKMFCNGIRGLRPSRRTVLGQHSKYGSICWRHWHGTRHQSLIRSYRLLHSLRIVSQPAVIFPSCSCSPVSCRPHNVDPNVYVMRLQRMALIVVWFIHGRLDYVLGSLVARWLPKQNQYQRPRLHWAPRRVRGWQRHTLQ